jgi:hypothetical protein
MSKKLYSTQKYGRWHRCRSLAVARFACVAVCLGAASNKSRKRRSFGEAMTPEDALLIFSKMHDEGTELFCVADLSILRLVLHGRVVSVKDGTVEIVSADRKSGFCFTLLVEGTIFGYREPRDFPEFAEKLSSAEQSAMALCVEFPLRTFKAERVTVIEVIRD